MAQQISAGEFQEKVLDSAIPVLVDFTAVWCGPCRMVGPLVDEIAQERAGQVAVYKLDVDANPTVAARYRVNSIPNLILFKGGKVAGQLVGARPKAEIEALLD